MQTEKEAPVPRFLSLASQNSRFSNNALDFQPFVYNSKIPTKPSKIILKFILIGSKVPEERLDSMILAVKVLIIPLYILYN